MLGKLKDFFGGAKGGKAFKWRLAYVLMPSMLLAAAVGFWWQDVQSVEILRYRVFDTYQRMRPRPYDPEAPVRIIDLDDESLSRLGQWPWPRTMVARLVKRLKKAGAGVIVFDAVFAEPDRTSPEHLARNIPKLAMFKGMREKIRLLPDNDMVFASAISEADVVTGFTLISKENDVRPAVKARYGFSTKNLDDDPMDFLPSYYSGAVRNLPELEKAAAGNGSFSVLPDADGVIRRVPLVYKLEGKPYPSLAAEALRVALGASGFKVKASGGSGEESFGQWTGIASVQVGPLSIRTDPAARVILHDTGYVPERYIPAWKVFEEDFDESSVAERILFIGTSAAGLKDIRATPLNQVAAGVELHAQITEQILLQDFLQRPDWANGVEFLGLLLLGLLLILLMPRLGALWCAAIAGAGLAAAWGGSWYAFTRMHMLFDPLYPSLVVVVVYLATSMIKFLSTESEKKQVRGAFSRYMSPALVEQLAEDPSRLTLGGQMKELTLMFSDIRGFTAISEQFDAHGLTEFINRYLTPMTGIVLDHRGTIDKYMGDCIMAFWNAPLDDPTHAHNACQAALVMRRRLLELNEIWRDEAEKAGRKFIPIRTGIGLNTGPCCVGNMGSDMRFDYSVLGDDVNLASRLEGQSKTYGVEIVIGENTRELALGEFAMIELDLIRVKGKSVPVHIYTLVGDREVEKREDFGFFAKRHGEMLDAYRSRKWDEAKDIGFECRSLGFSYEGLYDLYEKRCEAFKKDPPGKDWDGVFVATTK